MSALDPDGTRPGGGAAAAIILLTGTPIRMLLVTCPHCQQLIEILAINCAIFRCGVYKANGEQLPPHLAREECDRVAAEGLIYGCGRPFRVEGEQVAVVCDYI